MARILVWEGPGEVPNFCPEGCGGITEDRYGGPCKACWDAVGKRPDVDDDPYDGDDDDPRRTACNGGPWLQECDDPLQCCDSRCDGEWHPCIACGGTGLYEHQVIF